MNIFYLSKSQHLCSGKKNVFIKLLDLKSIRRFIRRKFFNNNLFKFFVSLSAVFFLINNWIEMDQLHHWVNRLKILTEFLLARIPMNLTHLWKNSMKKKSANKRNQLLRPRKRTTARYALNILWVFVKNKKRTYAKIQFALFFFCCNLSLQKSHRNTGSMMKAKRKGEQWRTFERVRKCISFTFYINIV